MGQGQKYFCCSGQVGSAIPGFRKSNLKLLLQFWSLKMKFCTQTYQKATQGIFGGHQIIIIINGQEAVWQKSVINFLFHKGLFEIFAFLQYAILYLLTQFWS